MKSNRTYDSSEAHFVPETRLIRASPVFSARKCSDESTTRRKRVGYLAKVPDSRRRKGRRHPLIAIFTAVICAFHCGHRRWTGIVDPHMGRLRHQGDAMFCQRDPCEAVVQSGGDDFIQLKESQPNLIGSPRTSLPPMSRFPPVFRVEFPDSH